MVEEDQMPKYPTLKEVVEELKRTKDIALPLAAMGLVGYLKGIISVVCMGKLGRLELAGGALAIGFTNITGYSVLSGLAMGMDPVCSQAFGSGNLPLVFATLQRTIIMLLCASVPIGLLWVNLEPVMLTLHQNPEITQVASLYCQFALPDLIANSLLHPLRIYLRSKGHPWPLMWCTLLSSILHLPITIFLAFTLKYGVPGVAVATFVTNFNTLIFLLCYMYCTHDFQELQYSPLFQPSSLLCSKSLLGEEWKILIGLAVPSCLGVCLEWWWYEFMTLLTGYLYQPHVTLAASAIVIQTTSLMYTLPTALSASVSTRVGNELGAGRPYHARLATLVTMTLAVFVSLLGFLWTTLGREPWGRIFTQDDDILKLTTAVLPIIGLCELANCPQTTGCGVLRGSARLSIGATINLYSFYLVGAPVAIALAFFSGFGFVGLCYGLLAAQITCVVSIITAICKTDWDKESLKAKDMVGQVERKTTKYEEEFLKEVVVFET
ncbi:Detoxification-like protein [Thalictrum thalictroides]|uniref:Protein DETOXIFICATION n=1 Tax=Thalictrum thalictroides TaxID=46969 RepID=A0A7J6WEA8_THATH|nr:Detoxification-like protein [Thalictrum thalictroides]